MKPTAIVIVGDLHAGSNIGLMPPTFTLDGGNVVSANQEQRWLWECWVDLWRATMRDYRVEGVIVNGDAPQGINARDAQTLTMNESDQIRFATESLQPLLRARDRYGFPIYATRGTNFHSGNGGAREETIWRECGAVPDGTGRRARWALWLNWRGKVLHATHHISVGSVYPHTSLEREMRGFAEKAAMLGWPFPDADLRAHVHRCYALEKGGRWIATSPAWQLATEFQYRVAPTSVSSIGGLVLWLDSRNDLQLRKLIYPQPPPRPVAIAALKPLSGRLTSKARTRTVTRSAKS